VTETPVQRCRSCGSEELEHFYEQGTVPVHSCRLVSTHEEALRFPTASLTLAVCHRCGFIANTSFDASRQDYRIAYEETQGFSPRFRQFMSELADHWIDRYDLHDKQILEIGSGKGEFLLLLCERGPNHGIGIDPGFVPERVAGEAASRVTFIQDYYSSRYAHLTGDAIVCRHTLEHIQDVAVLLRQVQVGLAGRSAVLLFELPDVGRVLREAAFWDVYYEHVSYFTPGSLARLFRTTGFDVLDLALDYDDQYVLLEAKPSAGMGEARPHELEEEPGAVVRAAIEFARRVEQLRERWRRRLREVRESGGSAVVWGAGSKAVAFLTTLGPDRGIEYAVDINPYKHGTFLAGVGTAVMDPAFLREHRPRLVIAMNEIYLDEIGAQLRELGVDAELEAV
jgi:SAM-dependent methyltransferase